MRTFLPAICIALSCGVPTGTLASAATPTPAQAPELFAGEMEDIGPQFLLIAAPRTRPLRLWTEIEFTGTSNATLVETNPEFSTITSVQIGGTWQFRERSRWGGRLLFETGVRLQTYRYGLFSGTKQVINFLEIDRNNFDLVGAHVQASWAREGWLASLTLRGATLENRVNRRTFYEEAALEWQIIRQWHQGPQRAWVLGADGAVRESRTDSFGLLPAGWNNRVDQSLLALVDQRLSARWRLQPAVRLQASRYLCAGRDRTDVHASARASLLFAVKSAAELRLSAGYDQRESSEALIADFRKWDLTLAGSAAWRF